MQIEGSAENMWITRLPGEEYHRDCIQPKLQKLSSCMIWAQMSYSQLSEEPIFWDSKAWGKNITAQGYQEHIVPIEAWYVLFLTLFTDPVLQPHVGLHFTPNLTTPLPPLTSHFPLPPFTFHFHLNSSQQHLLWLAAPCLLHQVQHLSYAEQDQPPYQSERRYFLHPM